MQKYSILLIFCLGFGQINWQIENVDKWKLGGTEGTRTFALALDQNDIPNVVYATTNFLLLFATRTDSGWEKETVETGLDYSGVSMVIDNNNSPDIGYYAADYHLNRTYLCYAQKINGEWMRVIVDSCTGAHAAINQHTSIDVDINGKPGVAYMAWEDPDSLRMIKYAYFDGISWSISTLTCVAIGRTLDYSPALDFDRNNGIPHIAFHRLYEAMRDTIFHALYNDTLNQWIIESAIIRPDGGEPIDMVLSSRGYPCIAYGWDIALAYAWWDGQSWHTNEFTGYYMGWLGIAMALALDSLDNPHIIAHGDPITVSPAYCYKESIWHIECPIANDTGIVGGPVSIAIDHSRRPNVCYLFNPLYGDTIYLRYAHGTLAGVEEDRGIANKKMVLEVYPSITNCLLNIESVYQTQDETELAIYDACGAKRKSIKIGRHHPGGYRTTLNLADLPCGTYFAVLKQKNVQVQKKFLLVR
jgi:hypothetical protein